MKILIPAQALKDLSEKYEEFEDLFNSWFGHESTESIDHALLTYLRRFISLFLMY